MNNTRYSQLGSTRQPQPEQVCEEHDGAPFTNFCTAITCVKPLCPECVQNHYIHHKNMRSQPELHSFKTLKNKCVNKIGSILHQVGVDEDENTMSQINSIFEQSLHRIRQARDNSRKVIDTYYGSLEEHVRKKMVGLLNQKSELFQQLEKSNSIMNELKLLMHRLENQKDFLSSAQTIIRLDGDKIQQKVKKSYDTVKKWKDSYRANLYIEKNYEQKLVNFLSKSVYYGNYQNIQTMPRIAEQIMAHNSLAILNKNSSQENIEMSRRSNFSQMRQKSRELDRQEHRSTKTRKSSSKSMKAMKKNIIGMNSFKDTSAHKYLHFFQNDENILHYLDLECSDAQFSEIQINIGFKIPEFHKSIAIPNGDLFLIGGSIPNSKIKSQKIYKYDFQQNTLIYCNSLKYGRSSHSICFNNKYIYVLGGICNNQTITDRCQRYDIINNKVEEIQTMKEKAYSFACCSFNGRYVYKFGGIAEDNCISHYIEVYDEKEGNWSIVNPTVEIGPGQKLLPLATSAAVQITQNQIMVMGGYSESNEGQKQTYILRIQQGNHFLRDINSYPLPYAEAFWNNLPIIEKKMVFALQNVSQGRDDCIENYRRVLVFDGQGWKCLNH